MDINIMQIPVCFWILGNLPAEILHHCHFHKMIPVKVFVIWPHGIQKIAEQIVVFLRFVIVPEKQGGTTVQVFLPGYGFSHQPDPQLSDCRMPEFCQRIGEMPCRDEPVSGGKIRIAVGTVQICSALLKQGTQFRGIVRVGDGGKETVQPGFDIAVRFCIRRVCQKLDLFRREGAQETLVSGRMKCRCATGGFQNGCNGLIRRRRVFCVFRRQGVGRDRSGFRTEVPVFVLQIVRADGFFPPAVQCLPQGVFGF